MQEFEAFTLECAVSGAGHSLGVSEEQSQYAMLGKCNLNKTMETP